MSETAIRIPDEGIELMSLSRLRECPELLQKPDAVIPRIAWPGRITLLAGREKSGKSTLLTAGVAAMSRGHHFLGEPTEQGTALWLSADMESVYDIDQRFQTFNADPDNTYLALNWDHRPISFLNMVVKGKPKIAVIDTLPAYAADIVTEASQSSQWIGILRDITEVARRVGTAFVLLHHAGKMTGEYRDSTHIGAAVDCILTMREDPLAGIRRFTARARWPVEDFGIRLNESQFELLGRELSVETRVLLHIIGSPGTSLADIRRAVGGKAELVDGMVTTLLARGAIKDIGSDQRHKYIEAKPLQDNAGQGQDNPGTSQTCSSLSEDLVPPCSLTPKGVRNPGQGTEDEQPVEDFWSIQRQPARK